MDLPECGGGNKVIALSRTPTEVWCATGIEDREKCPLEDGEDSLKDDWDNRLPDVCGILATSNAEFLRGKVTSLVMLFHPLFVGLGAEAECIRGSVPEQPPRSLRGGSGGGLVSRGGKRGASVACFVRGDVSPTEDSRFLLGGSGGGGKEGGLGRGGGGGGILFAENEGLEG